jgi:coenzyme F420-0:L-glutamate ligase/coenzyme F420-1:gamma-L-glutamate ligase
MHRNESPRPQDGHRAIEFIPLTVEDAIRPEETNGRTAGGFFLELIEDAGIRPRDKDVLVVSSKAASFFEADCLVRLADVIPSRQARLLGRLFGRDPRKAQLVLDQGNVFLVIPMKRIIRIPSLRRMLERRSPNPEAMWRGFEQVNSYTFVVRKHAVYLDEAGIDHTNSPDEFVSLLPRDPCETARAIRGEILDRHGVDVAVILSDTVTCVGRLGSQDMAIGYSGIDPITRVMFSDDLFGVPRAGGIDIVIDSIAGMAGLVMGQTTERRPAVLVRGLDYAPERDDDAPGMDAVAMPAGSEWRIALYTVLATLRFRLGSLLALQWNPRRPGGRR